MTRDANDITHATRSDLPRLFEVWEASVRATHGFLSEADIQMLIPFVKDGLAHFLPLYCLRDNDGEVYAFLGVASDAIEMLFVHPEHRGRGAGRALIEFAVQSLRATRVDVNEQNTQAVEFYHHLGFRLIRRSPRDSLGNPFPLLHLALATDVAADRVKEVAV